MFSTILVEVTGVQRSGTSAKGRPYCMFEAFVHLPNVPYPQKASFYAESAAQAPHPGTYECDVIPDVRDGRLEFNCDPRNGRRKNIPPLHAAKTAASA